MTIDENDKFNVPGHRSGRKRNVNFIIISLLRKWWIFLIVGTVAGIAGIYYASQQPIAYKSKLTFALDGSDGASGAISLAAQFGLNIGGGKDVFAGDNIIVIMKSRRMIERTLLSVDTFQNKAYTFIEYYLQQKKKQGSKDESQIHFPAGQSKVSFTYAQDSLLYKVYMDFLNNYIEADRPDRKYNIYEVNVTNPDEKFTKDFTDRLVTETNKFYTEISTRKSKETLDILEKRVAIMRGNVDASISSRAEIQDINLNPAFSSAQVPVLKQQSNIKAYGDAYAEMFKNLEVARFQYLKQIPLLQIIETADYPMQKIRASRLKTAIVFSFIACFITFLVLWLISLFRLEEQ